MARKPRRYPPKSDVAMLAAQYTDCVTGDLVLLFQPHEPTIVVRVPAADRGPDQFKRPKRSRKVVS
jgi:hypothetical protein